MPIRWPGGDVGPPYRETLTAVDDPQRVRVLPGKRLRRIQNSFKPSDVLAAHASDAEFAGLQKQRHPFGGNIAANARAVKSSSARKQVLRPNAAFQNNLARIQPLAVSAAQNEFCQRLPGDHGRGQYSLISGTRARRRNGAERRESPNARCHVDKRGGRAVVGERNWTHSGISIHSCSRNNHQPGASSGRDLRQRPSPERLARTTALSYRYRNSVADRVCALR